MSTTIISLIVLISLLTLSGFISASETALLSFKNMDLEAIGKTNPVVYNSLKYWLKRPNDILSAILITNNASNILISSLSTSLIIKYYDGTAGIVISTAIATLVVLIFGEITPKLIAKNYSSAVSQNVITPIIWMSKILFPFVFILTSISKFIGWIFRFKILENDMMVTEKDIMSLISVGEEEGIINEEKKEMLDSVFNFSHLTVSDIVVPRQKVYMLDANTKLSEVWEEMMEKGFSRVPIFDDHMDNITGAVYVKDLIPLFQKGSLDISLKTFQREIQFVPETKNAFSLLKEFREEKIHMAIVVDEYGGTVGIITIEDILEEIVGDIRDEYDKEHITIKKLSENRFLVQASLDIEDVNEETGLEIPESENYDSIGGFVISLIGRVPQKDETIKWKNLRFFTKDVDKHRIKYVIITKKDPVVEGDVSITEAE